MAKNKSSGDFRLEPDLGAYEKAFNDSFNRESEEFEKVKKQKISKRKDGKVGIKSAITAGGIGAIPVLSAISIPSADRDRGRDREVDKLIKGAAVAAGGIGAIPLPGVDILPLTALQIKLAMKIADVYGHKVTKKDVMQLVAATVTGSIGRAVFREVIQVLKVAGWLGGPLGAGMVAAIAALVAASVTYAFGQACKAYYKSGMTLDLDEVGEIFISMGKRYIEVEATQGFAVKTAVTAVWKWTK